MIIGIAGGSGSGKSTLCAALIERIGAHRVAHIEQDHYYRALPPNTDKTLVNYDHPAALEFPLIQAHVEALKQNQTIEVPRYDFATHSRTVETVPIQPKSFILIEGILILSQPSIRDSLDLAVFVEADQELRFQRRATRDQAERGRSYESVVKQFKNTVEPMHKLFVEPSAAHADLIVSGKKEIGLALEEVINQAQLAAALGLATASSTGQLSHQ